MMKGKYYWHKICIEVLCNLWNIEVLKYYSMNDSNVMIFYEVIVLWREEVVMYEENIDYEEGNTKRRKSNSNERILKNLCSV